MTRSWRSVSSRNLYFVGVKIVNNWKLKCLCLAQFIHGHFVITEKVDVRSSVSNQVCLFFRRIHCLGVSKPGEIGVTSRGNSNNTEICKNIEGRRLLMVFDSASRPLGDIFLYILFSCCYEEAVVLLAVFLVTEPSQFGPGQRFCPIVKVWYSQDLPAAFQASSSFPLNDLWVKHLKIILLPIKITWTL